ncbi:MAG: hypothetical protein WC384_21520 [Prolixibacteraceae bacterium]|jgi:hypothetical protein
MIILLILLLHHPGAGRAAKDHQRELTKTPVETTSGINDEDSEVEDSADFSAFPARTSDEINNWELRKHDDDVFIYQRWMDTESGRKAREIYAEIQVNSSPREIAQIIRNEKFGTEWLSMADEYKVLHENSDSEWYAYSRFNFMPTLRFDLVTRNEMKLNPANHSITIDISGEPNYLPENEKYRRLSHFEGRWEFVSIDGSHTRIRYFMFSKTKPFLPRLITDPFVFNEMENCVTNVKKIAERP